MPNSRMPSTWRKATLGRVSVVIMAREAASQPSGASCAAAAASPAVIFAIGSRGPMTPVDITATERGGKPAAASAPAAIAAASASPPSPVHAFAQPELIATPRNPAGCSVSRPRSYWTGAAGNALRVNTAAALQGRSLTTSARSAAPFFLMPAATPAKRKPWGTRSLIVCLRSGCRFKSCGLQVTLAGLDNLRLLNL